MRVKKLIKSAVNNSVYSGLEDFEVRGISCNSKAVKDNFIFVAVKGSREDGNKFIGEAIDNGARMIITQNSKLKTQNPKKTTFIFVKDSRKALARLAAQFYGRPSERIKVIGITGTNGKTTVTYLIEAILKKAGRNPAVIGTINYRFKDKVFVARNTTPGPVELQSMLAGMLKEGVDYCLMEVSSHALAQDRAEGIKYHSAVFTNLTQDHLDYHKTLENYFQAKSKLFKDISPAAFVIINNDDKYASRLKRLTPAQILTYGLKITAQVKARDIKFAMAHTEFILSAPGGLETKFKTGLIGIHNIYNILAAVAWSLEEGIDLSIIKSAIEEFSYVPGRLERIGSQADFSVFVDYAHTEDALKNAIKALRPLSKKRIIVVFGCGGERDRNKRPKMGSVVTELSDFAIITNDNPRSENPKKIIRDIQRGITKDNYCVIPERHKAIKKSLSLARAGDIVLVAGKGHEDYQILKNRTLHFDDGEAIRKCLKSLNY